MNIQIFAENNRYSLVIRDMSISEVEKFNITIKEITGETPQTKTKIKNPDIVLTQQVANIVNKIMSNGLTFSENADSACFAISYQEIAERVKFPIKN